MPIFHDTSFECALAIVQDAFRVRRSMILEDRCANFHEGYLSSQTPNEGCRMVFDWVGGPIQEFSNRSVADMAPGTLYRQSWTDGRLWRLALRPEINAGLIFLGIELLDDDDDNAKQAYRKLNPKFSKAEAKIVPLNYI